MALSAIRNEETIAQLAAKYEAHPTMINNWEKALLEGAADLFDKGQKARKHHDATVSSFYYKPRPISTDDLEMMKEIDADRIYEMSDQRQPYDSRSFLQDRAARLIASGFSVSCD